MKQSEIKEALCNIEIDKIIIGSHMEQLPEHIIDLILYFTYSYQFKNIEELRTAVHSTLYESYPDNKQVWEHFLMGCFESYRYEYDV